MASIGTTWDRTVDCVHGNLNVLVPVVLLTQFAPTVVTGSLEAVRADATGVTQAGLGLLSLLVTLIALWGGLYLTGFAAQADGRERADEAKRIATARFLPLIGVSLLLLVLVSILAIPGIALVVGSGFDYVAAMNGTPTSPEQLGTLGGAVLYFAVFGVAMLWLFARLLPFSAVVAMERRGAGAIARAFALTRGMTFKLIGLLILYGIVAGVAVSAARFVVGIPVGLLGDGTAGFGIGAILVAAAVSAVSALLALYQAVFVGKLYRALAGDGKEADVFA